MFDGDSGGGIRSRGIPAHPVCLTGVLGKGGEKETGSVPLQWTVGPSQSRERVTGSGPPGWEGDDSEGRLSPEPGGQKQLRGL